jgi:hypothetical protein
VILWPFRRNRVGNPDPEAFLAELAASYPGKYRPKDRYRDFRRVFLDSEQGRRVLYELLSWGNMFRPSAPMARFDPYETMFHDGERNVALKIMSTMHAEPRERPVGTKEE